MQTGYDNINTYDHDHVFKFESKLKKQTNTSTTWDVQANENQTPYTNISDDDWMYNNRRMQLIFVCC